MPDEEIVLVTGYPSLLARTVCEETLRVDPSARVLAVVRGASLQDAKSRVEELPEDARRRLTLMDGDPAGIDLGLSGAEFKDLARSVTRIHHCAQVTYLGVEADLAEHVNVGGAREIIELGTHCEKLKSLVFQSTAHVSGDRQGVVLEDDLKAGQSFRNAVEETKARAEKLARAAMDRVPIVVVRPSNTVGDSSTGEVDHFDGPYLLIVLVVTSPPDLALPLPGRGEEPLNLVPMDWVARASVALGRDPQAPGRTFHLVDAQPLLARDVFALVARAGGRRGPRGSIPANLAKALLRTPGLDRLAKSPRAFLEALTTSVTYDSRHADEALARLRVPACPPFESYVERLVAYVQERVRQRRQGKRLDADELEDPQV